jgi:hypothetical protein
MEPIYRHTPGDARVWSPPGDSRPTRRHPALPNLALEPTQLFVHAKRVTEPRGSARALDG